MNLIKIAAVLFAFSIADVTYAHGDKKSAQQYFVGVDSEPGKVVTQFHKALKEQNKDVARSLLADDVLIYEGGGVERSADEYASHHMLSDMAYIFGLSTEVLEHQVFIEGDIAVSNSRTHTKGTFKGKDIDRKGMETIVLKKINGKWKIWRIHWS
jgi:ketosteroid isomerase-like protein